MRLLDYWSLTWLEFTKTSEITPKVWAGSFTAKGLEIMKYGSTPEQGASYRYPKILIAMAEPSSISKPTYGEPHNDHPIH